MNCRNEEVAGGLNAGRKGLKNLKNNERFAGRKRRRILQLEELRKRRGCRSNMDMDMTYERTTSLRGKPAVCVKVFRA